MHTCVICNVDSEGQGPAVMQLVTEYVLGVSKRQGEVDFDIPDEDFGDSNSESDNNDNSDKAE